MVDRRAMSGYKGNVCCFCFVFLTSALVWLMLEAVCLIQHLIHGETDCSDWLLLSLAKKARRHRQKAALILCHFTFAFYYMHIFTTS